MRAFDFPGRGQAGSFCASRPHSRPRARAVRRALGAGGLAGPRRLDSKPRCGLIHGINAPHGPSGISHILPEAEARASGVFK